MFKKVIGYIDSLLFPPHCPFCERIMDYREDSVCGSCLQSLPFILEPRCKKCGKELKTEGDLCEDCISGSHIYEQGRAVWKYEGAVADSILRFKYHNQKEYAEVYACWIVRCLGKWINSKNIDVIIPVPIHKKRMRQRGYNQTELIAEKVAARLKITYDKNCVLRYKNTIPQKKLSALARMKNMQKAFEVSNGDLKNKNILVIDDIYTTGVTIDAISFVLAGSGANKVYFVAVAEGA